MVGAGVGGATGFGGAAVAAGSIFGAGAASGFAATGSQALGTGGAGGGAGAGGAIGVFTGSGAAHGFTSVTVGFTASTGAAASAAGDSDAVGFADFNRSSASFTRSRFFSIPWSRWESSLTSSRTLRSMNPRRKATYRRVRKMKKTVPWSWPAAIAITIRTKSTIPSISIVSLGLLTSFGAALRLPGGAYWHSERYGGYFLHGDCA